MSADKQLSRSEQSWTDLMMDKINKLTPDIKGKAFNPEWFLLRQCLEEAERRFTPSESELLTKFIRCVWVVEREYGYGKAMRVVASDHPRFVIGSRFDYGFLNIAVDEGYRVQIDPVPPHVLHDMEEARRERKQAQR